MVIAPIKYIADFIKSPDEVLIALKEGLDWESREGVPRKEYYCNDTLVPYSYGVAEFSRTYEPKVWHPSILAIRNAVEKEVSANLDVCFLNYYMDERNHLGWHADDSPEMDDNRPIVIVSFGAVREFWICPKDNKEEITKLKLGNGSICVMLPGMQDEYLHRIPKASFKCGTRISLTFRGYIKG